LKRCRKYISSFVYISKKSFLMKCGESRVGLEKISLQMSYIKNVFLES
jgi:hypothetical protein